MHGDTKRIRYASGNCFTVPDFECFRDNTDFYGRRSDLWFTFHLGENSIGHDLAVDNNYGDTCDVFTQRESEVVICSNSGVGAPKNIDLWVNGAKRNWR